MQVVVISGRDPTVAFEAIHHQGFPTSSRSDTFIEPGERLQVDLTPGRDPIFAYEAILHPGFPTLDTSDVLRPELMAS
jgi:hypothetical protein